MQYERQQLHCVDRRQFVCVFCAGWLENTSSSLQQSLKHQLTNKATLAQAAGLVQQGCRLVFQRRERDWIASCGRAATM
jgi:hypothetical protein